MCIALTTCNKQIAKIPQLFKVLPSFLLPCNHDNRLFDGFIWELTTQTVHVTNPLVLN